MIVPNYNHHRYLPDRLNSIFNQNYVNYELLLLDDSSSDESVEYLEQFSSRPNTRLIVNNTNSGSPFAQWNRGVHEAKGTYIWIAESDDCADPQFLSECLSVLESDIRIGIVACGVNSIDEEGIVTGTLRNDAFPEDRWTKSFTIEGSNEIRDSFFVQNTIPSASAVVFRKSIYIKAGDADASYKISGDWLQWSRMLVLCHYHFIAKKLASSRVHSVSQRVIFKNNCLMELESVTIQYQIKNLLLLSKETIRKGADRYATSWLQSVRAGRYSGTILAHLSFFYRLCRVNRLVATHFLLRFPYCLLVWIIKNMLLYIRR